ncbi:glycine cleavage system protein T [Marivivens niveibacter]|uniref:aminomethyltransferase n=1 Tax=Marivivens niveibacter TaxID=1930667 RepID=A0A251WXG0_9RHOB|nr:glycine cleavage system aminomethyltransferase GcvT [Marivivens niveibacter]OUD09180.1 glycine cleavage system protein T [Marivivens niveibacter]
MTDMKRTGLYDLHVELGAKMVPFAGYEMPVQYPLGVMKEHLWTREHAGLFDVSHMGQVILRPKSGDVADAARALETLVPVDVLGLAHGRQRYAFFTNEQGGILDDLMIVKLNDDHALFLVVNAACKDADIAHLRAHLSDTCEIEVLTDRALIALQGPKAELALARIYPRVADMRFMDHAWFDGDQVWVSRSGYSGEDGFEISVPAAGADAFVRQLLAMEEVEPIGLGARDSLRLEAGLCLYGSDLDETTTPVAADLKWAIQKSRRTGDRAGGFPGADIILNEFENGAATKRVGLRPEGRAPMRAHTPLFDAAEGGNQIGEVTSGAFGPSIQAPMSMGYIPSELAAEGTTVWGEVRGKRLPAKVTALPFRPSNYKR